MRRGWTIALALLLVLHIPDACGESFMRQTSDYFGTVSMLRLYDTHGAQETWTEVKSLLDKIDRAVSVSDENSDIARFNRLHAGESLPVSEITADIFCRAQKVFELTGGLYDPTVYPLVDLWGFSPRFNDRQYRPSMPYDRPLAGAYPAPPDSRYIDALLPLVGLKGIELTEPGDGWMLVKHTPAVIVDGVTIEAQLDLGGIAKGYACDRVRELLLSRGYSEGYFICGDSSMTFLNSADHAGFRVTAGKPRATENVGTEYARFVVENSSLATSSDATHAFDMNGVHWCHLIDPRTGWPVNRPDSTGVQAGIASVTLVGEEAALLDALGTALCVMGPKEAARFLTDRSEKMVMALWHSDSDDYKVVTNMPSDELELPDPAYQIVE